jgi:hypothetical protein
MLLLGFVEEVISYFISSLAGKKPGFLRMTTLKKLNSSLKDPVFQVLLRMRMVLSGQLWENRVLSRRIVATL